MADDDPKVERETDCSSIPQLRRLEKVERYQSRLSVHLQRIRAEKLKTPD